jgi:hypothetical protein
MIGTSKSARRRSASLDVKQTRTLLLCLDGIRFATDIALLSHARVRTALDTIEPMVSQGVPSVAIVPVIADAWSMVDAIHRLGALIGATPLIPKQEDGALAMLRLASSSEPLRHHVQHLNKEVHKLPNTAPPLMGAVTWASQAEPLICYTIQAANPHLTHQTYSLVFDTHAGCYTNLLEFSANDAKIDLDHAAELVRIFDALMIDWAANLLMSEGVYEYRPPNVTSFAMKALRVDSSQLQ